MVGWVRGSASALVLADVSDVADVRIAVDLPPPSDEALAEPRPADARAALSI